MFGSGYASDYGHSPYATHQPSPAGGPGSQYSSAPSPGGGSVSAYLENPSPAGGSYSNQPTPSPGFNFTSPMTPSAGGFAPPGTPGTGNTLPVDLTNSKSSIAYTVCFYYLNRTGQLWLIRLDVKWH